MLPGGQIGVLPESALVAYGQDFPFGVYVPPGIMGMQSTERFLKWAGEQSEWVKISLGVVGLLGASVAVVAMALSGNPYAVVMGAGAVCGALHGCLEASYSGGDFSDKIFANGLGAAFGAICPLGGIGGLVGAGTFRGIAYGLYGNDEGKLTSAWQWGGLIGGVVGDIGQGALMAGKIGLQRRLLTGLAHVGPDLAGAGAGAILAYGLGGDLNTVYHGATLGMMGGSIAGAAARGLWAVRRAVAPNDGAELFRRGSRLNDTEGFIVHNRRGAMQRVLWEHAERARIDLSGIKVNIRPRPEGARPGLVFGHAPNRKSITIFRDAFQSSEELVRSVLHETAHLRHLRRLGVDRFGSDVVRWSEKVAYRYEAIMWERVKHLFGGVQ